MNVRLNTYMNEVSQLAQDSHPLEYLRTNVPVQQFKECYKAFGVKKGDGMYLAPKDRLVIWEEKKMAGFGDFPMFTKRSCSSILVA